MHVLIVDDNPDVAATLAALLRLDGHAATTAGNGHAALTLLELPPPPDVIVLDLRMPGMDGVEFLKRLRGRSEWVKIPVVVVTATTGDVDEALMGTAVIRKPVEPPALIDALKSAVLKGVA